MFLAKAFVTVSSLTLVSRVLGFVRDILTAAFIGAGPLMDAFLVAFKFPNFFRRLFAEGAFNAAFVPMYSKTLDGESKKKATEFASSIGSWLLVWLLLFTVVIELAMPWFLPVIAPGFLDDPALFETTVGLARITFPYLLCISLVSLLSGILNAHKRYGPGAAAPILLNLSFIGALLLYGDVESLAWAVFAAGLLQLGWLALCAKRAGVMVRFGKPTPHKKLKPFFKKLVPGLVGAGVVQINLWVDVLIGTFITGAISYLYFADRVVQLPLSLVGTAMGTALLPLLSKLVEQKNTFRTRYTQNRALELSFFLILPATAGLIAIAQPITSMLFERGEFSAASSYATALAMQAYAVGLPAFVMIKILTTGFFAHGDTSTPVRISIIAMLTNLVLNITFVWWFPKIGLMPHVGLALATSIAAWLNVVLLYVKSVLKHGYYVDLRLVRQLVRMLTCVMLMIGWLWLAQPTVWSPLYLAGAIASSATLYWLVACNLGALPKNKRFRRFGK